MSTIFRDPFQPNPIIYCHPLVFQSDGHGSKVGHIWSNKYWKIPFSIWTKKFRRKFVLWYFETLYCSSIQHIVRCVVQNLYYRWMIYHRFHLDVTKNWTANDPNKFFYKQYHVLDFKSFSIRNKTVLKWTVFLNFRAKSGRIRTGSKEFYHYLEDVS